MKKKILSLVLALALCLGLAVPAFASSGDNSVRLTICTPDKSGILIESTTETYTVINVTRNNNNTAIAHTTRSKFENTTTQLIPQGVDIVVTGAKSTDEIELLAWTAAPEDAPEYEGYLYQIIFILESDDDVQIIDPPPYPATKEIPINGKEITGHPTATAFGLKAAQDGSVIISSDFLHEAFAEDVLLQVKIGDNSWLFWLSGEPKLISSIFSDVPAGDWFTNPVAWARQNDITTGTSADKFSPGQNCTQAQILTFLYRAAREEQIESSAKDMELAVEWAREKGMIDNTFDGNKPCTRATAVNYIWQAFDKPSAKASNFTDVDANADYAGAVSWAVEKEVTNGTNTDGTTFSPDEICTRGHIVTFLYRAYTN